MGLLNNTKVYLAGPIEFADDNRGGVVWRNEITPILKAMGVRVYDPMVKPSWYPEITKGDPGAYVREVKNAIKGQDVSDAFNAIKFIEKADLRYIHDCEWVIVFMPRTFTVGTIVEIEKASEAGKPIFVVCPDKIPSSWFMGMVATADDYEEIFFTTFEALLQHLSKIDNNQVPLDPLKWMFLSYFDESISLKPRNQWSAKA